MPLSTYGNFATIWSVKNNMKDTICKNIKIYNQNIFQLVKMEIFWGISHWCQTFRCEQLPRHYVRFFHSNFDFTRHSSHKIAILFGEKKRRNNFVFKIGLREIRHICWSHHVFTSYFYWVAYCFYLFEIIWFLII